MTRTKEYQLSQKRAIVTGWGRTQPVAADLFEIPETEGWQETIFDGQSSVIARGLGRSYGDAAQVGGGRIAILPNTINASQISQTTTLEVGAGTSIESILSRYVTTGLFIPVTPGTRYVTVGGAFAADIHGKNHHIDGSFANHVESFDLVTPTKTLKVTKEGNPEIFWATAGGMGLTGIITNVKLKMIKVESAYMSVETRRISDLDELMATMAGSDSDFKYSVAWIDCLAKGASMGRGVLSRAQHATTDQLDRRKAEDPLHYNSKVVLGAPRWIPSRALNFASVSAFNELWYRKAPRLRENELIGLSTFFHPLDGVRSWNRIYGKAGFLQYQFVVPDGKAESLRKILERISAAKVASFLAVLKRFGPSNEGILSFPSPGWTLALDIPVGSGHLSALLDELDEEVLAASGRIYLAKDSRTHPETIARMYPRLGELKAIKERLDPKGILKSDLSRRLQIP